MTRYRVLFISLVALVGITAASCQPDAPPAPTITLSLTRVPAKGHVELKGTGFTPMANVTSHLLEPDGREYPWLPILTDENGEFTHDIDTLLLLVGPHEVWVDDDTTGVSSNVARFEVTLDQAPPEQ